MFYEFPFLMKDFAVIKDFMKLWQGWNRSSFLKAQFSCGLSEEPACQSSWTFFQVLHLWEDIPTHRTHNQPQPHRVTSPGARLDDPAAAALLPVRVGARSWCVFWKCGASHVPGGLWVIPVSVCVRVCVCVWTPGQVMVPSPPRFPSLGRTEVEAWTGTHVLVRCELCRISSSRCGRSRTPTSISRRLLSRPPLSPQWVFGRGPPWALVRDNHVRAARHLWLCVLPPLCLTTSETLHHHTWRSTSESSDALWKVTCWRKAQLKMTWITDPFPNLLFFSFCENPAALFLQEGERPSLCCWLPCLLLSRALVSRIPWADASWSAVTRHLWHLAFEMLC